MQQFQQLIPLFTRVLIWIGVTITMPVSCLFCRQFGERSLSLFRIFYASLFLVVLEPVLNGSPNLERITHQLVTGWTAQAVILRAILVTVMLWHWIDIQVRKRQGVLWHSKSLGVPWLGADGKIQRLLIQPGLTLVISNLWLPFNEMIAAYFYAVAILLFLSWWLIFWALRNRLLDMTDQRIEIDNLRAMIEQRPANSKGDMLEHVITPIERNNAPDLADIVHAFQSSDARRDASAIL